MQLAFIDNPIALMALFAVLLLVFGPEKMKDIGKQLGKAIRDVRKVGSDFKSSLDDDERPVSRYQDNYNPTQYDTYGNKIEADQTNYTDYLPASEPFAQIAAPAKSEPKYGDFASSAFADTSGEYGVAPSVSAAPTPPVVVPTAVVPNSEVVPVTADKAVSRNKQSANV